MSNSNIVSKHAILSRLKIRTARWTFPFCILIPFKIGAFLFRVPAAFLGGEWLDISLFYPPVALYCSSKSVPPRQDNRARHPWNSSQVACYRCPGGSATPRLTIRGLEHEHIGRPAATKLKTCRRGSCRCRDSVSRRLLTYTGLKKTALMPVSDSSMA